MGRPTTIALFKIYSITDSEKNKISPTRLFFVHDKIDPNFEGREFMPQHYVFVLVA